MTHFGSVITYLGYYRIRHTSSLSLWPSTELPWLALPLPVSLVRQEESGALLQLQDSACLHQALIWPRDSSWGKN